MKKALWAAAMLLASPACLAPTDDLSDEETVPETSAAITAHPLDVDACTSLSNVALSSMWTGIMLICVAATDGVATGPCMSGVSGAVAGGSSGLASSAYSSWVGNYCNHNVCARE